MSTPAAIAVYVAGTGAPDHVDARPWRGVYHHLDGMPSALGNHLVARVRAARGDVAVIVRQLVDEAPWGWSSCWNVPLGIPPKRGLFDGVTSLFRRGAAPRSPDQYGPDDPGSPVAPDRTTHVAFVYAFDVEARRLDVFATHARAHGERIASVSFASDGEAAPRALDLEAEELVAEPALPGPALDAATLTAMLEALPDVASATAVVRWTKVDETDGALVVTCRVFLYENADDELTTLLELEWPLVPPEARGEPDRVRHALDALVDVLLEDPRRIDGFWLTSLDPLRRTEARQRATFAASFRRLAARRFGGAPASLG